MNKENIGIINFWWTINYGAHLTAFALQKLIKHYNKDSILITNPLSLKERDDRLKSFSLGFEKTYLKTTKCIDKNLEFLNDGMSIFITGSDQVFRPIYMRKKNEQYLLDFAKADKKKIAFSASFGVDKELFLKENSEDVIEHMKNSLKSFDFISVREKSGVEICRDLFDVDAEWIIDPVFILDKSNYDKLIKDSTINYKSKIVSYVLDTSEEYEKTYQYLSKKYSKDVVKTANSNISIESWLASIRDCDLFVTDSFHGMCFAIIFNKPFICLANKSRGGSRFESICEMLGIDYQCIGSINEVMQRDCVFKIDYNDVNKRIVGERQRGLDFLKKALDAPMNITQEKIDARMRYLEKRVAELEKQNNLKYQLWQAWKNIFMYFPEPLKKIIGFFWNIIK